MPYSATFVVLQALLLSVLSLTVLGHSTPGLYHAEGGRCERHFAMDSGNGECISKSQCWAQSKVYVNWALDTFRCMGIAEIECSSSNVCHCPPGFTLFKSKCAPVSECKEAGYMMTLSLHHRNAQSLCQSPELFCPSLHCACADGRIVEEGGNCLCNIENCEVCDSLITCGSCHQGYFPSDNGSSCPACSAHCKRCSNANSCSQCDDATYLDPATKTCEPCLPSCSTCSGPDQCDTCPYEKYGPTCGTSCWDKFPGCWECNATSESCIRCWLGNLEDGMCMPLHVNNEVTKEKGRHDGSIVGYGGYEENAHGS